MPSKSPVLRYTAYLKLALQILHAPVALDSVARMAKELKVADGVESAPGARRDVIYGQDVEGQFVLASKAPALLAGIQQLLVRLRVGRTVKGSSHPCDWAALCS